jgi:Cof subfamily protein (haloacid dehalogenase superfamily)
MRIQLLAIDLDGTLLRPDHTPHPFALEQLAIATAAGVRIVIASGRSIQSIRKVLDGFLEVDAAVATNGADVWASSTQQIHKDVLNLDVKRASLDYALQHDLHLSCYSTDGTYALSESEFLDEYRELVKGIPINLRTPDQVMAMPIFKLVYIVDAEQVPRMRLELEPRLTALGADITESAPRYLEILPKNVNKGSGLEHLCQHFGLKMDQIAAIGDYRNDIEMIKIAGLSGAVSNALDEVKQLAQFTVRSNEEGGVGEFIARYVLQP